MYDYSSGRKEHGSCISNSCVLNLYTGRAFLKHFNTFFTKKIKPSPSNWPGICMTAFCFTLQWRSKKQKQNHIVPFEKSDWKIRVPVKHVGDKKLKKILPNKKIIIQYFKKLFTFSSFSCCAQTHNNIYKVSVLFTNLHTVFKHKQTLNIYTDILYVHVKHIYQNISMSWYI